MQGSGELEHSADRALLATLQREVRAARLRLTSARHRVGRPGGDQDTLHLRAVLLASLERYAATLERIGAPVPHSVQTEIRLYRALTDRS